MGAPNDYKKQHKEVIERISKTLSDIPAHRKAFKKGYSFSKELFETQLEIWHYIWKNAMAFRPMVHAFFFIEQHAPKKERHKQLWETSVSWQEEVTDWPLCDSLSKINTKVLESFPDAVYSQLKKWNKDKDLWKRRQSVVSLLYYARTKKTFLPFAKIEALVTPLLSDKEYYVQKGLGWTLREMHNVYPKETRQYLQQHIKNISAIAFTIAIEKFPDAEKNSLKTLRKRSR